MQKLKLVAVVLIGGSLTTGCATAPEVRAKGLLRTYETASSPEQVRDCLLVASHVNAASPFRDGWLISNSQNPNVAQLAEIERVGEGAFVKVFTGAGQRTLVYQVEKCV
jgi:hypothetical protein